MAELLDLGYTVESLGGALQINTDAFPLPRPNSLLQRLCTGWGEALAWVLPQRSCDGFAVQPA